MRSTRTLGLVIVAGACLLLAVWGGSTASATALCKTNSNPCSEEYAVGTEVKGSLKTGTELSFTTAFATVKCTGSEFAGKVESLEGEEEAAVVALSTLKFTGCNCTVTTLTNGSLLFIGSESGNATVKGKSNEVTITCAGLPCKYGTGSGTSLGKATGGEPSTMQLEGSVPWVAGDSSSAFCTGGSGTGTLKAEYTINPPNRMWYELPRTNAVVRVPGGLPALLFKKGEQGKSTDLEVENAGNTEIALESHSIDQAENNFEIIKGGSCTPPNYKLKPGVKCTVTITFRNGGLGGKEGTYTVKYLRVGGIWEWTAKATIKSE